MWELLTDGVFGPAALRTSQSSVANSSTGDGGLDSSVGSSGHSQDYTDSELDELKTLIRIIGPSRLSFFIVYITPTTNRLC